jgi:hypothetical protein
VRAEISGPVIPPYGSGSRIYTFRSRRRTRQAFGKEIWPNPFRDCAMAELVDCVSNRTHCN